MLGSKKAVPLWRRRTPNFLVLERSLKKKTSGKGKSTTERAVIARQLARQSFEVSKGRVRPPA